MKLKKIKHKILRVIILLALLWIVSLSSKCQGIITMESKRAHYYPNTNSAKSYKMRVDVIFHLQLLNQKKTLTSVNNTTDDTTNIILLKIVKAEYEKDSYCLMYSGLYENDSSVLVNLCFLRKPNLIEYIGISGPNKIVVFERYRPNFETIKIKNNARNKRNSNN